VRAVRRSPERWHVRVRLRRDALGTSRAHRGALDRGGGALMIACGCASSLVRRWRSDVGQACLSDCSPRGIKCAAYVYVSRCSIAAAALRLALISSVLRRRPRVAPFFERAISLYGWGAQPDGYGSLRCW